MSRAGPEPLPPKLFISYSWTSEDHKQWVLDLATGLRENGIEVILDRWHLLDGQDTHVFMERMVNDPEIKHVALICDQKYVARANSREGGVGAEAQIITPNIYASHQQTKFVAVVTELDEHRKPFVPTYYGAKKWIVFLDPSNYADDFDTLLRWVFDKPLDKPPPIGKRPAFLSEDEHVVKLGTTSLQRRAVDAIRSAKANALPSLIEYLDRVVEEFEKLRITQEPHDQTPFDEHVITSIRGFLPYRNELVTTFVTVAMYANEQPFWDALHRFFERLIPFQDRPEHINSWNEFDFDNFRFIIHELFLYLIAANVKYERFDALQSFLSGRYYIGKSSRAGEERMREFSVFRTHLKTLDYRKERLRLNVWSLQSSILNERSGGQPVDFESVMTADIILWFRNQVEGSGFVRWFPLTFVHLGYYQPTLELFARAQSTRYLAKILPVLGVGDLATLRAAVLAIDSSQRRPTAGFDSLSAGQVMGVDKLGTSP